MNPFLKKISKYQKILFFLLAIVCGILILAPTHNFQPLIAQGDHGRDLYAFEQTLHGAKPYQDYWWVYGPLMPYYYALSYKLLGVSIQSVLIAEIFLKICSGLIFYGILSLFFSAGFAFLGALWLFLFHPVFFHTYNHAGAITCQLAIFFFLCSYLRNLNRRYIFPAVITALVLCLIKINFGLFNLLALLISLMIIDLTKKKNLANKKIYLWSLFLVPTMACLIYWAFFLKGLPLYAIRQCIPVLGNDQPHHTPALQTFFIFLKDEFFLFFSGWISISFTFLIVSFTTIFLVKKPQDTKEKEFKKNILLLLASLLIFIFLNLHEFLASGVPYRALWIKPFKTLFIFIIMGTGIKQFQRPIRILLYGTLITMICLFTMNWHKEITLVKNPEHSFQFGKTDIYIQNSPSWLLTVQETVRYLKTHLGPNDNLFALPYDPIYYFLLEKTSPTRQLIFFDHIHIPGEQELGIIAQLEKKNVTYIVLSNRRDARELGLGTFGKTYCPLLASYIKKNFIVVETIGDWKNEPGWAWNYGTTILKRIQK